MVEMERTMPASKRWLAMKTAWLETAPTPIMKRESVMSVVAKLPNPSGPFFFHYQYRSDLEKCGWKKRLTGLAKRLAGYIVIPLISRSLSSMMRGEMEEQQ